MLPRCLRAVAAAPFPPSKFTARLLVSQNPTKPSREKFPKLRAEYKCCKSRSLPWAQVDPAQKWNGEETIGSPKSLTHNWPQDKSLCLSFKAHFFLLSERLGTQGRGAGTSAWALETPLPLPEPMETDWQVGLAHPNKSPVSFLLLLMCFFFL